MKKMGITFGDEINLSYEPAQKKPDAHTLEVVAITQKLIKRHKQALKNLNHR